MKTDNISEIEINNAMKLYSTTKLISKFTDTIVRAGDFNTSFESV